MIDLRQGRWQDCLQDITCDFLCADPPFGARTHAGHNSAEAQIRKATGQKTRTAIGYDHWTPADVAEFVAHWSPRTTGWMSCMTSHDLIPSYEQAYAAAGRLPFAPVGILMYHPRLLGDGPPSGLVYLMVSRPRSRAFQGGWNMPPWYGPYYPATEPDMHIGGKPLSLMLALVRDYSRPGNLICDPCSGGGTTAIACHQTGRRFVGSECDPVTYAKAQARIAKATRQAVLFEPAVGERGLL